MILHIYEIVHSVSSLSLSLSPSIPLLLSLPLPQVVVQADPDLVALHCQEVGGKEFETCMPKVKVFIKYALSVPYIPPFCLSYTPLYTTTHIVHPCLFSTTLVLVCYICILTRVCYRRIVNSVSFISHLCASSVSPHSILCAFSTLPYICFDSICSRQVYPQSQ